MVAVWNMNDLNDITRSTVLTGHTAAVRAIGLDDRYIVSGSDDKTIMVSKKDGCLASCAYSST